MLCIILEITTVESINVVLLVTSRCSTRLDVALRSLEPDTVIGPSVSTTPLLRCSNLLIIFDFITHHTIIQFWLLILINLGTVYDGPTRYLE